jgi:hypothetical protein
MSWQSRVDSDTRDVGLEPAGSLLPRRLAGARHGARAAGRRLARRARPNAQEDLVDVVLAGSGPGRAVVAE